MKKLFLCLSLVLVACGGNKSKTTEEQPVVISPAQQIQNELKLMTQLPKLGERKTSVFKDFLTSRNGSSCAYLVEERAEIIMTRAEVVEVQNNYHVTPDFNNPRDCPMTDIQYPNSTRTANAFDQWREKQIQEISSRVIPDEYRKIDASAVSATITSKVETTYKGIRIYEIKMDVVDNAGRVYQQVARLSRDSLFIGALDWDFFSPEQSLVDYKHNVDVYLPQ